MRLLAALMLTGLVLASGQAQAFACDARLGERNHSMPDRQAILTRLQAEGLDGMVRLQLRFSAEAPPEVTVIERASSSPRLIAELVEHLRQVRLLCDLAPGKWLEVQTTFMLTQDQGRYRKDQVGLREFLRIVREGKTTPDEADFDLNTMGCPFVLGWRSFQTEAPNELAQLDGNNPARAELLGWLASLRLRLNPFERRRMAGVPLRIEVPCGHLDGKAALTKGGWAADLVDLDNRQPQSAPMDEVRTRGVESPRIP